MTNKVITSIQLFWVIAPQNLKNFVKYQIQQNGYGNDLSGALLSAHVWECTKWTVTVECCHALIEHYNKLKI